MKIRFRPMNGDDIPVISEWFSEPEDISVFDRSLPVPVSKDFVAESWKPALQYSEAPTSFWFILEAEDGSGAGVCGIQSINYIHGDAVVPLFIAKPYRKKGLGKVVMSALIDFGFDSLRLHRLTTFYRSDNISSKKLTEFGGFVEEGRVREGWYADGKHYDEVRVGLLKSDWHVVRPKVREQLHGSPHEVLNPMSLRD